MHALLFFFASFSSFAAKPLHLERWKTSQGTPVVFYQAMDVPMLDISIAFRAGSAYDNANDGLSALTAHLLNQGNAGLNANAIADQFANIGAQYTQENNRDSIVVSLRTLSEPVARQQALETFIRIIAHPDFPEKAFFQEKNQQLLRIKQTQESPDSVADETFFRTLFQNHPYAHPINGDIEHVNKLSILDVKHFYQRYFVAQNAIIVIVGAIDKQTAEQYTNQLAQALKSGSRASSIVKANNLSEEINIEVSMPSSQSVLRLGQLGVNYHDAQYFPLLVGNYILGGGNLVSRLATELREKEGLTYGVYSQFTPLMGYGPFVISLSTKDPRKAEKIMRKTLLQFLKTGPTEQELIAAKQYIVGSFPLSVASNQSMARILLNMAFYDLPDNYLDTYLERIQAVSVEDIRHAFQQHIHPKQLLDVEVGHT
jgi:zinc protease